VIPLARPFAFLAALGLLLGADVSGATSEDKDRVPGIAERFGDVLDSIDVECRLSTDDALRVTFRSLEGSLALQSVNAGPDGSVDLKLSPDRIDRVNRLLGACLRRSDIGESRSIYQVLDLALELSTYGMTALVNEVEARMRSDDVDRSHERNKAFISKFPLSSHFLDFLVLDSKVALYRCSESERSVDRPSSCLEESARMLKAGLVEIEDALNGARLDYDENTLVPYYLRSLDDLQFTLLFYDILSMSAEALDEFLRSDRGERIVRLRTVGDIVDWLNFPASVGPDLESYVDQVYVGDFVNFCGRVEASTGESVPYAGYMGDFAPYHRLVRTFVAAQMEVAESDPFRTWLEVGSYVDLCAAYVNTNQYGLDFRRDLQLVYEFKTDDTAEADDRLATVRGIVDSRSASTGETAGHDIELGRGDLAAGDKFRITVGLAEDGKGLSDDAYHVVREAIRQSYGHAKVYFTRPKVVW